MAEKAPLVLMAGAAKEIIITAMALKAQARQLTPRNL